MNKNKDYLLIECALSAIFVIGIVLIIVMYSASLPLGE